MVNSLSSQRNVKHLFISKTLVLSISLNWCSGNSLGTVHLPAGTGLIHGIGGPMIGTLTPSTDT